MVFQKKSLRFAAMAVCAIGMSAGLSACGSMDKGASMTGAELSKPDKTIVEIATGSNMGDVSTLVDLVKKANLVDTLNGAGPFTVFAPTNEAFAKFKGEYPEKYAYVTDPAHVDALAQVLKYHVIPGKPIMSTDIMTMPSPPTADKGQTISVVKGMDGSVTLNGNVKVIKADIVAKNGVIHWVDDVLLPPDMKN